MALELASQHLAAVEEGVEEPLAPPTWSDAPASCDDAMLVDTPGLASGLRHHIMTHVAV